MSNSILGSLLGQNITSQAAFNAAQNNSAQLGLAQNNAAQGMHAGAIGMQNATWSGPKVSRPEVKPDRTEMHVKITQAENGFIVGICNSYGDVLSPHIAVTMEDVNTIITSQLASRMLDRSEG